MKKYRVFAFLTGLLFSSAPAWAVVEKTDILDGTGGAVGTLAVLFFMWLCFRGDKYPPEGLGKKKEESKDTK